MIAQGMEHGKTAKSRYTVTKENEHDRKEIHARTEIHYFTEIMLDDHQERA